ncbi:MAG: hypothetical protein K2G55_21690 [Lachnospiraceae bacterium]|nr:hypothetical protein [Lachnospiraceae bacterium]
MDQEKGGADGYDKKERDSRGFGWIPIPKYVKKVKVYIVKQAKEAFRRGKEQIFLARSVIGCFCMPR